MFLLKCFANTLLTPLRASHTRREGFGSAYSLFGIYVRVNCRGHHSVTVAETVRNYVQVLARPEKLGRVSVARIVKAVIAKSGLLL